jgi:hypothetical protein
MRAIRNNILWFTVGSRSPLLGWAKLQKKKISADICFPSRIVATVLWILLLNGNEPHCSAAAPARRRPSPPRPSAPPAPAQLAPAIFRRCRGTARSPARKPPAPTLRCRRRGWRSGAAVARAAEGGLALRWPRGRPRGPASWTWYAASCYGPVGVIVEILCSIVLSFFILAGNSGGCSVGIERGIPKFEGSTSSLFARHGE